MPTRVPVPKTIYVSIPPGTANNMEKMNRILMTTIGKAGCPGCHSGFNIKYLFDKEILYKVDAKLNLNQIKF